MKILIHLNTYNDVDHITPIIWRLLEKGGSVTVIFLSNFDYANDYRIKFLSQYDRFSIYNRDVFLGNIRLRLLYVRRKIFFNSRLIRFYKSRVGGFFSNIIGQFLWPNSFVNKFDILVYEGGGANRINHSEAHLYNIPVVCLPHGLNIFLNYDITKAIHDFQKETGAWPDFSSRNNFDLYVVQSERHRQWSIDWGLDPGKAVSWGSARFCPEWSKINLSLIDSFKTKKESKDKLRIVFFLPHWVYNVNVDDTLSLIFQLAEQSSIYLVIKGHTRGSGSLNDQWEVKLNKFDNVEANVSSDSPTLIAWSDMVINVGSSIAIEAVIQNTLVVHAMYLHSNKTVFDKGLVAQVANSAEDVLALVSMLKSGQSLLPSDSEKTKFLSTEVFAGQTSIDVLELYYENISNLALKQ